MGNMNAFEGFLVPCNWRWPETLWPITVVPWLWACLWDCSTICMHPVISWSTLTYWTCATSRPTRSKPKPGSNLTIVFLSTDLVSMSEMFDVPGTLTKLTIPLWTNSWTNNRLLEMSYIAWDAMLWQNWFSWRAVGLYADRDIPKHWKFCQQIPDPKCF